MMKYNSHDYVIYRSGMENREYVGGPNVILWFLDCIEPLQLAAE